MNPIWVKALEDIRTWSATRLEHKQGWIRYGCLIRVVEEYKGWYRVDTLSGPHEVVASADYPEIWIEPGALTGPIGDNSIPILTLPVEVDAISAAEAFDAFKALVQYIKHS